MAGESDLQVLLKSMSPIMSDEVYVFVSLPGSYGAYQHLDPLCSFVEKEGLTLIIPASIARTNGYNCVDLFRAISLEVHSSLNAVGLTAAVATKLAGVGISANVVAAFYHDHVFVPDQCAARALAALEDLSLL
jgi:hypothetical protein